MQKIETLGVFKDFSDDSLKSVFSKNGNVIEMTLLFNRDDRDVICVPTHHFCNLGCKMCHLTNDSIKKAMIPIVIDDFVYCLKNTLTENGNRITDKRKLLISFMGVGEPLLNLQLIKSVYAYESEIKQALGYDAIGYSISTMMPNDNIKMLTNEIVKINIPLKIHFSLHTPIDNKRFNLLPSTHVKVSEALEMLSNYAFEFRSNSICVDNFLQVHTDDIPVEIHYTLIDGVNDSDEELKILCAFLKKYAIPIKFIRFNPINKLKRSENEKKWLNTIKDEIPGLKVKAYSPPGKEVGSSCGEFTKHYYHAEIETEEEKKQFEAWKQKHQIR